MWHHAQDHHVGVLDVHHVRGQSGHEAGRGELVDMREGERLDGVVLVLTQVAGESGRRARAEHRSHASCEQTDQGHAETDMEEDEQHSGETVRIVEIDAGRLVRNDHDHADLNAEQTNADGKQQREGEDITSLPQ